MNKQDILDILASDEAQEIIKNAVAEDDVVYPATPLPYWFRKEWGEKPLFKYRYTEGFNAPTPEISKTRAEFADWVLSSAPPTPTKD